MVVILGSDSTGIAVRRLPVKVTFINQHCPFDQAIYKGIIDFKVCILHEIFRSALRARKLISADPYVDSYGDCS